jgi:FkbM family methyltransferase
LTGANAAVDERMLAYDRKSGRLTGAGLIDKVAVRALQAGSALTRPFGHRGYGLGCKAVSAVATECDIVVRLNADAVFAMPFSDRYWSRILDRRYDYEEEIEALLTSAAGLKYTLIDCGANFGYWSVLATSKPFGCQQAIAIEASPANAARLETNARLNAGRFKCLNAAIGAATGGYARIVGQKHEAFAAIPIGFREREAVRMLSVDGLVDEGFIDTSLPCLIKLDVEGQEIEALDGARRILAGDSVVICEDHGADRNHSVTRHLIRSTDLKTFAFDPTKCRFFAVTAPSDLDRIKRHTWVGYNVFATSSPLWQDRLLSATWAYR